MEPQQLATKVAQLESRVATLEDEGKIVKGEVKQVLTEIRTAILVRDNPFETDGMAGIGGSAASPAVAVVAAPAAAPARPQDRELAPEPPPIAKEPPAPTAKEPVMLRPLPQPPPAPAAPQWSLLTIAGLSAWAEEAMLRVGALRLEILLDLCEAAGHLTPGARVALARVTEMDIPDPLQAPSTNETVAILRQLDALLGDADANSIARQQRSA